MICKTCNNSSVRIRIINGHDSCSFCGGFSEANGIRIDGVLSRQRVRGEAVKYEGDTLNPWRYEKSAKGFVPNDDFIKLHGNNARNFFGEGDLKAYPKLAKSVKENLVDKNPVSSVGEYEPAIKEAIKKA